jgi:hypothetical protein
MFGNRVCEKVLGRVSEKQIKINESKIYFGEGKRIILLQGFKVSPICPFDNDSVIRNRAEIWF